MNSQSISTANASGQTKVEKETSIQIQYQRPEAIAQRELQEFANNSQQVKQLRAIQQMADNRKYTNSTHIQQQKEKNFLACQNTAPAQLMIENGDTPGGATSGNGNTNTAAGNATRSTDQQRQGNSFTQHLQNATNRDINDIGEAEFIQWLNTNLTAVIRLPGIAHYNDDEAINLFVRKWPYVVVNGVNCELWINYHIGEYIGLGSIFLRPGGRSKISPAHLDREVTSEVDERMKELMPENILNRINGSNSGGGAAASLSNSANNNVNATSATGSSNSPAYRPGAFGGSNQANQTAALSNNANNNVNAASATGSSNSPAYRPGAFGRANQANQTAALSNNANNNVNAASATGSSNSPAYRPGAFGNHEKNGTGKN